MPIYQRIIGNISKICINKISMPKILAPVAQWIEQQPSKLLVEGSIPSGRANTDLTKTANLKVSNLIKARLWLTLRRNLFKRILLTFGLVFPITPIIVLAAENSGHGGILTPIPLLPLANSVPLGFYDGPECSDYVRGSSTNFRVPRSKQDMEKIMAEMVTAINKEPTNATVGKNSQKKPNDKVNFRNFLTPQNSITLRVAYYAPAQQRKNAGTIIIIPERTGFIEKYCDIISYFRANNFAVLIYDLRGMGLSARQITIGKNRAKYYDRGYVESFDDYVRDHQLLIERFSPSLQRPLYLLAVSLGANIASRVLMEENKKILTGELKRSIYKDTVLISPLWEFRNEEFMNFFLNLFILPSGKTAYVPSQGDYSPKKFWHNRFTHNEQRFNRNNALIQQNKNLRLGGVTYGWLKAAIESNQIIRQGIKAGALDQKNQPNLMVVTTPNDRVAYTRTIPYLLYNHLPNVIYFSIPTAKHEILQEQDELVISLLDNIVAFFKKR